MLLEDDALRDVTVDNVESEVESFRSKTILKVNFDEKVDEVGSHVPSQLGLLIDKLSVGHRLALWTKGKVVSIAFNAFRRPKEAGWEEER